MTARLFTFTATLRQKTWWLLTGSLTVLWSLAAALAYNNLKEADARMDRFTDVVSLAVAEHTQTTLNLADYALVDLRDAWLAGPEAYAKTLERHRAHLAQFALQTRVVNAQGWVVQLDQAAPASALFAGDSEYFKVHQQLAVDGLHVSRPIQEGKTDPWAIQVSRPMFRAGRWAGVVVLSLDPHFFAHFYQRIDLGSQGLVSMVSDSGELMARSLDHDAHVGKTIADAPFLNPAASLRGHFRRMSPLDEVNRSYGYVRLPQYRLTVLAGVGMDEQLAPLRRQRWVLLSCLLGITVLLGYVIRSMFRSIAAREAVERGLEESQQRYQGLVDNLPMGIVVHRGGSILYVNPSAVVLGGARSAQELVGTPLMDRVHPDFRAVALARIRASLADGGDLPRYEEKFLKMDGSVMDVEIQGTAIQYQGAPAIQISFQDITQRKRTDEDLRLAASVFTHAREGIMITDPDGTIVAVNATFTQITGYTASEAMGQNPRILNSGRQGADFYVVMWTMILEQGHWSGEIWNRHKNGGVYAELLTVSAVRDSAGRTQNYVALFSDITPMKEYQSQLERIAHYDALTGLPNRVLLADRLNQAMLQSQRHKRSLAVVYLDLDGFKSVNDSNGHPVGDELLIMLAQRMKDALRDGDSLARYGGDEFVAVLVDLERAEDCEPVLARLLHAAAAPLMLDSSDGQVVVQVSASLGVTLYPQDGVDADVLVRHADHAMYLAKQAGKNRYHLFDVGHDSAVNSNRESLNRIQQALDGGEFVLYYQPKVNMQSGEVIGAEALIRWLHPERGLLSPAAFLPAIENTVLSVSVGEWVLDTALSQMAAWQSAGLQVPVSINVSSKQLLQEGFARRLGESLARHPSVASRHLELEILETSALDDISQAITMLQACRMMGVKFALDDFGTGYSSLTYLKHLPAETLKIDQSFVRDMLSNPDDLAIVTGVIGLAKAFGRQVIAEGVETAAHGDKLMSLGCFLAQGYGIARPMPASQVPDWVAAWQAHPQSMA